MDYKTATKVIFYATDVKLATKFARISRESGYEARRDGVVVYTTAKLHELQPMYLRLGALPAAAF